MDTTKNTMNVARALEMLVQWEIEQTSKGLCDPDDYLALFEVERVSRDLRVTFQCDPDGTCYVEVSIPEHLWCSEIEGEEEEDEERFFSIASSIEDAMERLHFECDGCWGGGKCRFWIPSWVSRKHWPQWMVNEQANNFN